MRCGLAAIGVLVAGCSTGNFDQLPRAERRAFERCTPRLSPAVCNGDDPRMAMCQIPARREYGAQAPPRARQRWLLENGCPPSMVTPDRYVDEQGPVARRQEATEDPSPVPRRPAPDSVPQAQDPE